MTTATLTPIPKSESLRAPDTSQARVLIALAVVYLVWGSTYLALKWVVFGLPTWLTVGARFLAAGSILFTVLKLRGERWPTLREWAGAVPAGVLLFVVGNGFVALAEREVSSAVAAVVCGTMPLLLAAFSALGGERFSRREVGGLLLGFLGVAVMTSEALQHTSGTAKILLLAPVGWALGSLATRKLPQAPGLMSAASQMVVGGTLSLLLAWLSGESLPAGPLDSRAVLAFFYLVLIGSVVAFSAYSYLLRNARPSLATSYAYVNPGIAILLGALLGGESITFSTVAGGALVVAAVALIVRGKQVAMVRSR
jgi:drug/metabolite transporter (DMT)-like permease